MLLEVKRKRGNKDTYLTNSDNVRLVRYVLEKNLFLPMTLNRATLPNTDHKWTSAKVLFNPNASDEERLRHTFGLFHSIGLDEPLMTDQPNPDKSDNIVVEITYEMIRDWMNSKEFKNEGTLWNVLKRYSAFFIRKEVRDRVYKEFGIDLSLVYPSADCAVVRFYDEKEKVMGIAHVDAKYAGKNLIQDCVKFAKDKLGVKPKNMFAFVNAFASKDYVYRGKAPDWAVLKNNNNEPIVGPDGFPILNTAWSDYIQMHYEDGVLISEIDYGRKVCDQLVESGISRDHTSFSLRCTRGDSDQYSNADFAAEKEQFREEQRKEITERLGSRITQIDLEKTLDILIKNESFKLENCGRNMAVAAFPLDNNGQPTKLYKRAGLQFFQSSIE